MGHPPGEPMLSGEYGCLKKYLSYSFNLSMKIILHRTRNLACKCSLSRFKSPYHVLARSAYPVAESVYKGHYSGCDQGYWKSRRVARVTIGATDVKFWK